MKVTIQSGFGPKKQNSRRIDTGDTDFKNSKKAYLQFLIDVNQCNQLIRGEVWPPAKLPKAASTLLIQL
jgi:hypothetical protein